MNNNKTRIGILGLGGIGGFVGGLLAKHYQSQPNVEIIFICRGETLAHIRQHGLLVRGKSGNFAAVPALASDKPAEIGLLDVLILTTKTYSLAKVLQQYQSIISENTLVLPLQNSVTAKAQVLEQLGSKGKVLEGCIYVASNVLAPGTVQHLGGPGKVYFGADAVEPYRWLETLLQEAQIQAKLVPNIQEVLWSKFIFVGPLAAITTAYQVTFGQVLESEPLKVTLRKLMEEVKQLAHRKGIFLKDKLVDESMALIQQFPYETKSSLQLDFEKGQPTEFESLVTFVLVEGKKLGLPLPQYQEVANQILFQAKAEVVPKKEAAN